MKKLAFGGIVLSLSMITAGSFGEEYTPQPNATYQAYQANYRNVAPGSRYRSARTAFRMNLQDASGSELSESLPSPSDAKVEKPDQQVIGSSPVRSAPSVSSVVSAHSGASCNGCASQHSSSSYAHGYGASCSSGNCGGIVNYGSLGAGCDGRGSGLGLGSGSRFGCGGWNDGAAYRGGIGGALGGFGAGGARGWYGGLYGLIMTRSDDYGQTLSYDSANPNVPLMKTDRGYDQYFGGAEARIGKYFTDTWSIEGAYWGLYPEVQQFDIQQANLGGGDLRTALGFNNLVYDPGTGVIPVAQVFGDATRTSQAHRLRRSYEVHNAEINFVNAPVVACSNFNYAFLAGVRYFKYNDGFTFSTDYVNSVFGDAPASELHYDVDVDNNLVGFQFGSRMNYAVGCGFSVNGGANIGVYNNHISQLQRIRGGNGFAYDINTGDDYYIESSDDDLAFLGDISLGVAYDVGCNWRLTGGYRLLAASGIANSTNQIPRDRDFYIYDRVRDIDSHDSLILHGAFFGIEHTW